MQNGSKGKAIKNCLKFQHIDIGWTEKDVQTSSLVHNGLKGKEIKKSKSVSNSQQIDIGWTEKNVQTSCLVLYKIQE